MMARCPCGYDESSADQSPDRTSGIPRPDRTQNRPAPPSRNQIPCPYPGSRIPTRVPPYSGQPLYLPPDTSSQWPGMRANFPQEVRDFQLDPNSYNPVPQRTLITGKGAGGRMLLQRSNRPEMAVNQPIPERPPRTRGAPARQAPRAPVPPPSRVQPRSQTPQEPRAQARQAPRAISAGPPVQSRRPTRPPLTPTPQPVRSTGAIPRVPGVAMRVPVRSPPSPDDSMRQSRVGAMQSSRRPSSQATQRRGPPLDAALLRARQQAQLLGVSPQRPSRPMPRSDEYMGDFEMMERVAQQEHQLGVSAQQSPAVQSPAVSCGCGHDSFDEFEELEKAYEKAYAYPTTAPYTSPEALREFEQLEREAQRTTPRRPQAGQSFLPRPRDSPGLTLEDSQLRARQQARSIGVSPRMPSRAGAPRQEEYVGDFEMMERVARQEQELGVRDQQPLSSGCPCQHESSDEYEQLEKTYDMLYAPSDRVPYTSPEGLEEFEQLEQGTHLEAIAAPSDLQNLLGMPSVHLDVQPVQQQGSREPSELRQYFERQWEKNAAVMAEDPWQSRVQSSSANESSLSGQWCPPDCHGIQ